MRFIFSYLKKYGWYLGFIVLVKLAGSLLELLLPYVLEYMVDEVAPVGDAWRAVAWGIVMIVLALACRWLNVFANRRSSGVAKDATYRIRKDLFWHSVNLSGSQMDDFGLPSITSRMSSDSYNIQNFIRSIFAMGVRAPILLLGGIVVTLSLDPAMAAVLCVIAPIVIVCVVLISWKGIPLFDAVQQRLDTVVRIMRENITGILVVKALSKEDYERRRFAQANRELTRQERTASIVMTMPGPVMNFFLSVGLPIVVIVGAYRVNAGAAKPGVILSFLIYFNMILQGAMGLNRIFMMLSKANASANRIALVVNCPEDLTPIPAAEAAPCPGDGHIIFDKVCFRYGENSTAATSAQFAGGERQMSLQDISFSLAKGSSLGIIGATGCGKTTIVNLLMRFYDATEGHIFVNGRDVRSYDRDELHRLFGVVFQNDVVFADTIAENIRFGRDVPDSALPRAAADACAAEFIEQYDDGYRHAAAIGGANFSGGQKQRLLITRALAAKPEILVLDDASSALDYKTDALLRRAIREHYREATTIIIAQRVSSILTLDKILMLQEGKILGLGTHAELLESCPAYREIYEAQMGEGE